MRFQNSVGIEVKYFCGTRREAERYARMAEVRFADGPYHLVQADIEERLMGPDVVVAVDGSTFAYVLTDKLLRALSAPILIGPIKGE